jgi:S-adenosylmethionine synthetase
MHGIFTSESVTEGHPDKVCDFIADSVLDAHLRRDQRARVACEVLAKGNHVILAAEITSSAKVDYRRLVRDAVRAIGYTDPRLVFNASNLDITLLLTQQASEIGAAVSKSTDTAEQGAGDQGIMLGYATDETPELMPLPILLAHRAAAQLAHDRKRGGVAWLRPDGKTQVSVEYEEGHPIRVSTVVVSTMHAPRTSQRTVREYVRSRLLPRALGRWFTGDVEVHANPSGSFTEGGPSADAGVTGRKIIVDTYGGMARHGGGAFSGKDPSKVDRSGAYFCRWVARQIVRRGLARRAEVQVAYAIGRAQPVSVFVETFGTGDAERAEVFVLGLDFRPSAIIRKLNLLRPIYRRTTNYGHFGRPGLPWET